MVTDEGIVVVELIMTWEYSRQRKYKIYLMSCQTQRIEITKRKLDNHAQEGWSKSEE